MPENVSLQRTYMYFYIFVHSRPTPIFQLTKQVPGRNKLEVSNIPVELKRTNKKKRN